MNEFVRQSYISALTENKILRLSLSRSFDKDIYNYNMWALYYTEDSIVPIGKNIGTVIAPG